MKVPMCKQTKGACGPTSLKMVLAYYDVRESLRNIIKSVGGIKKQGVRMVKLAKYAKDLEFDIVCLTYNKKLGCGKAKYKKPDLSDIRKYIRRSIPVIVCLKTKYLFKEATHSGHYVVITGYRNRKFSYNDPHDGKKHGIGGGKFYQAWYENSLDSSAYLLTIYNK